MMTPEEQIFVETGVKPKDMVPSHHGCGHDRLEFNTNPVLNPLLRQSRPPFTRWYDNPFGFLRNNASLIPRGDIQSSNGEPSNKWVYFIPALLHSTEFMSPSASDSLLARLLVVRLLRRLLVWTVISHVTGCWLILRLTGPHGCSSRLCLYPETRFTGECHTSNPYQFQLCKHSI